MTDETHLARIESSEFGKIVIDNKTYDQDMIITANGQVTFRDMNISQAKYGTGHLICKEEIKNLLQESPRVIIIGTGQYGACRFEKNVEQLIKDANVKLLIERTPKAVHLFNNTRERKAGLFHLTC